MNDKIEQTAEGAVTIPSPYAKKWYDLGFLFAVNYICARLPETNAGIELNKNNFKAFINNRFTRQGVGVIDDKFFEKYPFRNGGPYGPGQCPGDIPNTCIPCTADGIEPLP